MPEDDDEIRRCRAHNISKAILILHDAGHGGVEKEKLRLYIRDVLKLPPFPPGDIPGGRAGDMRAHGDVCGLHRGGLALECVELKSPTGDIKDVILFTDANLKKCREFLAGWDNQNNIVW